MSPLVFTLLRFAFLALLWIFVLFLVSTLRRDVHGTQVRDRRTSRASVAVAPPSASAPIAPQRTHPQPRQLMLAVTGGPLAGTTLPLGSAPIIVGRSPDNALVLDDSFSSSRHARIYPQEGYWWIEDLDSTNGTYVQGAKISTPTRIQPGDHVVVGKTPLELCE